MRVRLIPVLVVAASLSALRCEDEVDLPPGSFVSPQAVELLKATIAARGGGQGDTPDKLQDQWTSSRSLRDDLVREFSGMARQATVLEVGSYFGYTTRLLSHLFRRVIALDAMPQFLQANREYNSDRDNILYLRFNTHDDWSIFAENAIDVVFLDASHDYPTVRSDLVNVVLKLPQVSIVVFDDYGAEEGVRAAVHEFIERGWLRPVAFLGEGAQGPWRLKDGRNVDLREAVACEVVRPAQSGGPDS